MASIAGFLTLQEFRARYGGLKPYYEYWNGEAVQKTKPTLLHGLVQTLIALVLKEAGYLSGSEVELRIDDNWQSVADVIGTTRVEDPYPTAPVEVVVEILSPDDRFSQVIEKCQNYARIGIVQIFVIDPRERRSFVWVRERNNLEAAGTMQLSNGIEIELTELWRRLDAELAKAKK